MIGGLLAVMTLSSAGGSWSQPVAPPIPQFPPGPDFVGVAGSAAETARIAALCGPNRNVGDGYTPTPAFPGQTRAPIVNGTQGYAVEHVADIDRPFGMDFLPDGKMLVSFRNGGMRIVTRDGVVSEPLANVPQVINPRLGSGMYDVLADRDFAHNRTIYFTFHTRFAGDAVAMGRIASARLSADERSLEAVKVLREGVDIEPRRIVQARDGTLLIFSFGDLADVGADPQKLESQAGKVLRINTDGTIPRDNPFLSNPTANPAVWALGFRDIHAAFVHPRTGALWAAENEPKGGDELNLIRAGRNYGFPVISYGRQNSGALINGGKTAQEGMEQPLYYWTPSIAPSGMALYTGDAFPKWKDNIFIGAMSGQQLVRLQMNGERVVAEEKLLMDRCQRIKIVKQGPEGDLYILTDQLPPKQNEILRLVPAKDTPPRRTPGAAGSPTNQAPVPSPVSSAGTGSDLAVGRAVYDRACAGCHGSQGAGGAAPRIAGRTDASVVAAVVRSGQGQMPPLGAVLSTADIEAVSRYLAQLTP
jgi:glucose/arabinose dehydrogenase/cytochrome c5